jgi:hypothetical protein
VAATIETRMFEKLPNSERIRLAKEKIRKVLDHFLYLVELHENNAIVVYSSVLVSQIPTSLAANAFNVFQRGMHQFEIVRLCALWDSADIEKENIPTVVELIDETTIIDTLAEEFRRFWTDRGGARLVNPSDNPEVRAIELESIKAAQLRFADSQASKAQAGLRSAISDARKLQRSAQLSSIMNHRDKHLAHSLTQTRREVRGAPVGPVKYGDETDLINASVPIVESLYCWVDGTSFSISESQRIDRRNAEALWRGCQFKVLE